MIGALLGALAFGQVIADDNLLSIEGNNLEELHQAMYDRMYSYEPDIEIPVNEDEVELLAHLLMAECGSDYCTDDLIYYTASVVMNRVESDRFPDNLHDVIYQKGQYECTWNGAINKTPTDRCYDIAVDVLQHGSYLPSNVVWQSEFMQGTGLYTKEQNTFFCY